MNRKIGMIGAFVNLVAVITFAASMLMGSNLGSYLFHADNDCSK